MPRHTNHLLQLTHQRLNALIQRLEPLRHQQIRELVVTATPVSDDWRGLRLAQEEPRAALVRGDRFGPPRGGWQQRWCRIELPNAQPDELLLWDCDGEATLWLDEAAGARPWAGLDVAHRTCPLPPAGGTAWIEVGTWQTAIWLAGVSPLSDDGCRFRSCAIVRADPQVCAALADLDVLRQLQQQLMADLRIELPPTIGYCQPLESVPPLLRILLGGIETAADAYDADGIGALTAALTALRARLPSTPWQGRIAAIAQTHIDLVYLWPERVGTSKGVHSCATALRLLDADPAFTFTHSQPLQYLAIREAAPRLMEEIAGRISEGRWEVTGGFAVEPDTQIPCGEALFRSLRIGQDIIHTLTGAPATVCWLPDTFGYSPCLPALLRSAGVQCLMTTKIAWSPVTRFPWTSFVWKGHDGSELLAHLCPVQYNGDASVSQLTKGAREHREAHLHDEQAVPVGYGDGGGGPNQQVLDRVARVGDLALVPRTHWSRVDAFAARLATAKARLPVHQGELFLEGHVAVGTVQRRMKGAYRSLERALQTWEAVRAATGGGAVPIEHWHRLCFAQFHDALPGTSIPLVFTELVPELEQRAATCLAAAATELGTTGDQLFNPLPFARSVDHEGAVVALPPLGSAAKTSGTHVALSVEPQRLGNGLLEVRFDAAGRVLSISDEQGPLPLSGPVGLTIAPDFPSNYDAWNTDQAPHRLARPIPALTLQVDASAVGCVRLRGTTAVGHRSQLTLSYELRPGERHLRCTADVVWQEDHQLMRVVVPTSCRGRNARYGCPFGSWLRVQQAGTMQDEAQWEVPGSRWAAVLADDASGVAICTRDSYGFSARDGELTLSLLRGPTYPDPRCDRGQQQVSWAIGRHRDRFGDHGELPTAAAAEALWTPALPCARPIPSPLAWQDLGSLVPAWAVPAAEGGVEVRLHEVAGSSGSAALSQGRVLAHIDACARRSAITDLTYTAYQLISVVIAPEFVSTAQQP